MTTQQVAKELGITISGVTNLANKKLITDVAKPNGKSRHHFKFRKADILVFKRTYIKNGRHNKPIQKMIETPLDKVIKKVFIPKPISKLENIGNRFDKIENRLKNIENKIDSLIQMWS